MKKLHHYDYEEGNFEFTSNEDKEAVFKAWSNENELTVDEYGRVFNEVNQYIADVIY